MRNKNTVQNKKIEKIINSSYYQGNQALGLWDCENQWREVIAYQNWSRIKCLYLRKCAIDNSALHEIVSMPWPVLKKLDLSENKLTGQSIKTIALFQTFSQLTDVSLSSNLIGKIGVQIFTKSHLPQLQKLWMSNSGLGNQGAKILVKGEWPLLIALNISKNCIGFDGFDKIFNNNWNNLIEQIYQIKDAIIIFRAMTVQIKCNISWFVENQMLSRVIKNTLNVKFKEK